MQLGEESAMDGLKKSDDYPLKLAFFIPWFLVVVFLNDCDPPDMEFDHGGPNGL